MATRIRLNALEQRIFDRVLRSGDFEPVENLLRAIGAERNAFVDALEYLEGEGLLFVTQMNNEIFVGCSDISEMQGQRIGTC